jgi:hypothetical protein
VADAQGGTADHEDRPQIFYRKSSVLAWLAAKEQQLEHPKQAAKRTKATAPVEAVR